MAFLPLLPALLALLALAAHFLRRGDLALVLAVLVLTGLLAVRRPWAARALQVVLGLGALEWARTLVELLSVRRRLGLPSTRLAIILGLVALVTGVSAWALRSGPGRRWFRGGASH